MTRLLRCRACGKIDRRLAQGEDGFDPTDTDLVEVGGFALCPCDPVVPGHGFTAVEVCGDWCEVMVDRAVPETTGQLDLFAE